VAGEFVDHPIVARVVAFIRAGGTRPLTMAVDRHGDDDADTATS